MKLAITGMQQMMVIVQTATEETQEMLTRLIPQEQVTGILGLVLINYYSVC